MKPNYSIRVLERAYEILHCFTPAEPEKSLTNLARETGLHKSTVFRILETLEGFNWVRQEPHSGLYRLSTGIFELGSRAVNGLDFYKVSRPHLEQLVKTTGQSAHLVIHDHGKALYLNKLENPGSFIAQPSNIGSRFPLHCTAVGKILLASMDEPSIEAIIAEQGLPAITPNTITSREGLYRALQAIKAQGHAVDNEEIQTGLRCVAAPVRGHTGAVVAAISVSGLTANLIDTALPGLIAAVSTAAKNISSELGCPAAANG